MGVSDHLTCLLRNLYANQEAVVKNVQGTTHGSKFGKKYDKAVYCHPACLTYMQNVCICQSLSHVWFFTTPWAVVHQASLSMEFSRQEYWNGLPFSSPGDLSDPGIKPQSSALQADSLPLSHQRRKIKQEPYSIWGVPMKLAERHIHGVGKAKRRPTRPVRAVCRAKVQKSEPAHPR